MKSIAKAHSERTKAEFRMPPLFGQGIAIAGSGAAALATSYLLVDAPLRSGTSGVVGAALMTLLPWCMALLIAGLATVLAREQLYRYGAARAMRRDRLFQFFGWSAAAASGLLVCNWLLDMLARLWFGTSLEGLPGIAAILAGMLVTLLLGVALHAMPRWTTNGRIQGRFTASSVHEILSLGAAWPATLTFLFVLPDKSSILDYATFHAGVFRSLVSAAEPLTLSATLLVALVSTAAYGILRIALSAFVGTKPGLWIVIPNERLHDWTLTVADALCADWRDGPVTLVAPTGYPSYGEHLYLAHQIDKLRSIFPSSDIAIKDWSLTLPEAERWRALRYRELYPHLGVISRAITQFLGQEDIVVLICADERALSDWDLDVPPSRTLIVSIGPHVPESGELSDFATVILHGDKFTMRKSCKGLVKTRLDSTKRTLYRRY